MDPIACPSAELQASTAERTHAPVKTIPYATIDDGVLSLRFHADAIQSRMQPAQPDELVLEYTRLLMAFQLFHPRPKRIAMIGLGGGSIAKYALRHLALKRFVAVEISRDVIDMRDQFHIPPEDDVFRIIEGNGADFIHSRTQEFDVLIVDAFNREGMPPHVCNAGFYDQCYSALSNDGILALNFHASEENFGLYVARLRESFFNKVICVATDPLTNHVVFAGKGREFPPRKARLKRRAGVLTTAQPINFHDIADKILAAISDDF